MSSELIELLKYMEHSTEEVSEQCTSERIQNNRNGRDHLTLFGWSLLPFLYGYTVPVIVRVLNPGLELHSPVVSLTVNVAAGTVTFPATVAKAPVASS